MLLRNATSLGLLAGLMLARPGACAGTGGTGMKKVQTVLNDDDWIMLSTSPKCNICATTNHGEDSPPGSPVVVDRCKNWDVEEGWRISTDPNDGKAFVVMLGNENGYTGNNKAVCMEATALKKNQNKNRARIRLAKCDIQNPLQRFVWNVNMKEEGQIQLEGRKNLCLTWSGGDDVDPGQTPVVVMPCDKVKNGPRSKGWSIC